MNQVLLTGNLTKDPDTGFTSGGTQWTRFTLAVQRTFSNKDGKYETDFIGVVSWDKTAAFVAKYLIKGSKAEVEARVQTGKYEKDGKTVYSTDIVANRVGFLDSKKPDEPKQDGGFAEDSAKVAFAEIESDDMPFR